jgi:hypothetical protein
MAGLLSLFAIPLAGCGGGEGDQVAVESGAVDDKVGASDAEPTVGQRTYSAKWSHTLVPEIGQIPIWISGTGNALPTVKDCWGRLRVAKNGEARFWGARRVENRIRFSADLTNAGFWSSVGTASVVALTTDSRAVDSTGAYRAHRLSKSSSQSARLQIVGVLPAVRHTFSIYARAGTLSQVFIQFYVSGGAILASGLFDLPTTGWTRVQVSGVPDGLNSCRVLISPGPYSGSAAGNILVCDAQLEDVSGHPNIAASEYVATDRPNPANWFYGAMVDGVRYFNRFKGNTVSSGGVVTEAAGGLIESETLRHLRLEPAGVNLCTQSEAFSSWTINAGSLTLTVNSAVSPRCDQTAARITESATFSSKFLSLDLGSIAAGAPVTVACFAKKETGKWFRLSLSVGDGSTCFGFFDVDLGVVGSVVPVSGRPCWAHIEPWGDGWFRCVLTAQNNSAARNPVMRIGMSERDGVTAYTGVGKSLLVWGAQASATEYPSSYIQNPLSTGVATRQSQSIELPNANSNVIGLNDYVVKLDAFLAYYSGITIKGGTAPAWRPFWYAYAAGAYRNQHRLGLGLRPTTVAFFGDRYLGDPNPLYFWRPNEFYAVGSVVIPTDTQLDNANARRMFVCVEAGVSGSAEPSWNPAFVSVPDTSTSITADGSVKWQNNHDNTIVGIWEPYDTSILNLGVSVYPAVSISSGGQRASISAVPTIRMSTYSAYGAYGYAVNGQSAVLRTTPFPIDGSISGDLHQPMESIRFGRLSEAATSHPVGIGNVIISVESIDAETNRLRTLSSVA